MTASLRECPAVLLDDLCRRARRLAGEPHRRLLGITGPPGVGKSTLAEAIASGVGETARLVEMDGFHFSNDRLAELGRRSRKGAVDTFDAWAFVALVRRLAAPDGDVIYAPTFSRDTDEPVAGAVAIEPQVRLVIVEGNYLLVADQPWTQLRAQLDEVWYCERSEDTRIADLIARHESYGKSATEARAWALGPDQRNAELISRTRHRADRIVALGGS